VSNDKQSTAPEPARSVSCPIAQSLVEICLIFMVFLTFVGNPVPDVNEPHYLARLKSSWNPAWCPTDLFLQSSEAHPVFVWTFGWLTRWFSLAVVAWFGRILCWIMLAWGWQRLSWRIVPKPLCSVLAAALFVGLNLQTNFAGEWFIGGFEAKSVAYVFVVAGLAAMVQNNWNQLWVWLGAATAFHALVGGWSWVVCSLVWLFAGRLTTSLRAMLPGLAVGIILSMAGIVPALLLSSGQTAETIAEANQIYVFERLRHHLAPLTLPPEEVTLRLVRQGCLLVGFVIVGFAVHRSTTLGSSTGLTRVRYFAWGGIGLAFIGLLSELLLWNHPVTAASLLKYYWFRLADFAVPLAVALHLVALVANGLKQRKHWAVAALIGAICLATWQLAENTISRLQSPIPQADLRMNDYAAWLDVCQWIKKHTPTDALFLTPRSAKSFKWRAQRAEVVTHKDIPQDAASVVQWHHRYRDIHSRPPGSETKRYRSVGHMGTERVKALANKYHFDYVVTDNRCLLALPIAYQNQVYIVYRVDHLQ
jgi:hypothetical protein